MASFFYSKFHTPVGPLAVAVTERGLARLEFDRGQIPARDNHTWIESEEKTSACRRQLEEYFSGARREFDLPLDLRGTDFEKRCWQALLAIPYGETRSYGDIARAIGSPKAFRAVGLANHNNPIAIVVPCHRVLGSNGGLTGYGGGLEVKQKLLRLEGALL